jgi:hypothetical protein
MTTQRFPIRFDDWYRVLSTVVFLPPSNAYVLVEHDSVEVRMSWAFRARFPRSAVASATPAQMVVFSRGVHGFAGRWLINGSAEGLVNIDLAASQRGSVMGFPIRLRRLIVSVDDPAALVGALSRR